MKDVGIIYNQDSWRDDFVRDGFWGNGFVIGD